MRINSPMGLLSGWDDWLVVAMVLVAFWAIPIAGTLALFGPNLFASRRKRQDYDTTSELKAGRVQCK